jgi:predicted metal-dependent hydrolase
MAVEHSEVQYGRTKIAYAILRSVRRATVAIAIAATGEVILTAPSSTPVARLDRVVHDKARWIVTRRRQVERLRSATPRREFVSGETFLYLGRQHRLIVRKGPTNVRLHRGRLELDLPADAERAPAARAALVRWYRDQAESRLPDRVARWIDKVDVQVQEVLVREQQKRWGSCDSSGTLRFNWRIIQAPMPLVDYVVAHELVHLRHRDHTRAYWSMLGQAMPEYELRRKHLARLGQNLVW